MVFRLFGWSVLAVLAAYVLNNYLTYWQGMPGALAYTSGDPLAILQLGLYVLALALALAYVMRSRDASLRGDAQRISDINAFIIRAAFWAVLIVGLVDMAISFLRVENMLDGLVGHELAGDFARSQWRGPYIHMPLIGLSIVIACFTRTLGFPWLALLVVAAELLIVLCRFIFSYEQAFMADLVRFWYAALFLFASAYTLKEEGHVRVDVFYTNFSARTKGFVNAFGSIVFGVALCWVVLVVGMGGRSNIINSPFLSFETTQAGFGLYVKYLMAGYLAVFAISMMIQFVSYFLDAVADIRGEPGGRDHNVHAIQ